MTEHIKKLRQELPRNRLIVLHYRAGRSISTIAQRFHLSSQRIHQILRDNGVTRAENPRTRTKRLYAFIGANIPHDLKAMLARAAQRQGLTMSAYVKEIIKRDLSTHEDSDE